MRTQNNFCALVHKILDSGKRALNTVFVGDNAVLHRYVKVHSYKALLALDVYVFD